MRNAFINELCFLAQNNSKIALVVGDLGYGAVEPFAEAFPDRFFNAGVAEQNMMGLCAGLASEGMHVFAYSIANFPTFRCAEQLRNDVAYHQLPVTVVAIGGGLAYGNLGYSHHAVQDYALIRVMPNMLIAAPADPMEVRACVRYLTQHPQPSYLRIGKAGEPNLHNSIPELAPGVWLPAKAVNQANRALLSTGTALHHALAIAGSDQSVYSLPLWSMATKIQQAYELRNFQEVTTYEDHLLDGGFGSWLMESVVNHADLLARIKVKALDPIVCGTVGSQKYLEQLGGLSK
jgi:transketolase